MSILPGWPLRRIGLGSGRAVARPVGRKVQASMQLSHEQRQGLCYSRPEWGRLRQLVRDAWPACCGCGTAGSLVDHIVPLNVDPSRAFDLTNLQTLCHSCHTRKTSEIDAPHGQAALYRYDLAGERADMRPESMKQWARDMRASGVAARAVRGKAFEGDVIC